MAQNRYLEVAQAFGVTPELLPWLPALLSGLRALGGWPSDTVRILRESADLPQEAAAIDLGCGQGGISIPLAAELGCHVTGVDLFQPFLEQARAAARTEGVGRLCSFVTGDIREVLQQPESYDVAIFSAVGAGLFEDYPGAVGSIRQCVHPGGYMVFSDGFLSREAGDVEVFPGYEYYRGHEQVINELTAHRDTLVREILISSERFTTQNLSDFRQIRKNALKLGKAHPDLRGPLERFLGSQRAEYAFLNASTREAIWLLRRSMTR